FCHCQPTPAIDTLSLHTLFRSRSAEYGGSGARSFDGEQAECTGLLGKAAHLELLGQDTGPEVAGAANRLCGDLDAGTFFEDLDEDRKSTRLNSSHVKISYAVFC